MEAKAHKTGHAVVRRQGKGKLEGVEGAASEGGDVASLATGRLSTGVLAPEDLLERLEGLLARIERDEPFLDEFLQFTRASTGGLAAFLIGSNANAAAVVGESAASTIEIAPLRARALKLGATALQGGRSLREVVRLPQQHLALLGACFRGAVSTTDSEVEALVGDEAMQVLVLVLGQDRAPFAGPVFGLLHLLTRVLGEREGRERAARLEAAFDQSTLLVDLFSRVSLSPSYRDAVHVLASELREFFGCQRVAIGVGQSMRCRLDGLSGDSRVDAGSQASGLLRQAMREAQSLDRPTVDPPFPPSSEWDAVGLWPAVDQSALRSAFEVHRSVTMPLVDGDGDQVGAWTLLWSDEQPLTVRKWELLEAATPQVAALLKLVRAAKPRGVRGFLHRIWVRASQAKRAWLVGGAVAVVALFLFPVSYRVPAACEIQPERLQQVAAPFAGRLESALVKPGDKVVAGQVLARLDGREIAWRLSQAIARREVALKKRDQAQAGQQDIVAAQIADMEAEAANLEVRLLRFQQNNLELRAPMDGYVLTGDLKRSEGVPVTLGQKLFDVAPLETLRLEMAVPDSEIRWIEPGMRVTFRLEAKPQQRFEAELAEVYPVSEVLGGENVFVALATVENPDIELRPGMRGQARVVSHRRPLGWILFHKPWDFLRVRL